MRIVYRIAGGETDSDEPADGTASGTPEPAAADEGEDAASSEPDESAPEASGAGAGDAGSGGSADAGADTGNADNREDEPGWLGGIRERLDRIEANMTQRQQRERQPSPRKPQTRVSVQEDPPRERPETGPQKRVKRLKWGKRATT